MIVKEVNVYVVDTGSFRPVVVETVTDEGISGIGEGAVGFGYGCTAAAAMIKELAEAHLIGRDPFNITDIWNDFYYYSFWAKGGGPIIYAAVSAIEMSLWDIKGKALNVPIYQLLGGKQRDYIHVYANDWSRQETPLQFAQRAEEVVADGFDAVKFYPLSQVDPIRHISRHLKNRFIAKEFEERCLEIVKLVRKSIGDGVDMMIDCTGESTTDQMIKLGQKFAEYNPYWYEEPIDPFDVDGYTLLKDKVNITIAAGERLYTRYGFKKIIENRGVDVVQPDPGTCGGILEAWHIGAMAEAYGMRIAPHNCGGPVLTAAAIQLSAAFTNLAYQEVFPYRPEIHYNIVTYALEKDIKDSYLKVPDLPGLGVELNHSVVDQFQTAQVK